MKKLIKKHFSISIEKILLFFSIYGVTLGIFFICVVAWLYWPAQHKYDVPHQIKIRVLEERRDVMSPAEAVSLLEEQTPQIEYRTNLSTAPFWFFLKLDSIENIGLYALELPSRHMKSAECWEKSVGGVTHLGSLNRAGSIGQVHLINAGFYIQLREVSDAESLVCKIYYEGPAKIEAKLWKEEDLRQAALDFFHSAGLLEGGLIILAVFVFTAAIINREWTYVIFAAWLIANLRVATLSAGWDFSWLGRTIPSEYLLAARQFSIAIYYTLTVVLFSQLFKRELVNIGYKRILHYMHISCLALIGLAIFADYKTFLPYMWIFTTISIGGLLFFLFHIFRKQRNAVAIWYSASIAFTLLSNLSEVIAAALGFKTLVGSVNSVSGALASSLLAALAIAEQMRQERVQRVAAQTAALRALDKVKNTFEASPVGLFSMRTDGALLQYNPAMQRMLGFDSNALLLGLPVTEWHWNAFFHPDKRLALLKELESGERVQMELSGPIDAPNPRWFLLQASLTDGVVEGSLQDVTEQRNATQKLDFLAYHDPLTSALNRRGIEPILDLAMQDAEAGKPGALAYLDLDRFKLVNDLYGHMAGDEVLKGVTARAERLLDRTHALARVGGDEFLIVMRETTMEIARTHCEGLLHLIESKAYRVGDKAFRVKGSIGLTEIAPGMQAKDAIAAADRACRQAKRGRYDNLVVFEHSSEALRERMEEIRLVEWLSSDSAANSLFLEMQPIMSVQAPFQTLDFEVLVRMQDPSGKIIPAGKLVAAAEANGRISMIDRWVLRNVLAWLDENQYMLINTRFVCVNISGGSLNDERFVNDIYALLAEYRGITGQLCLEITEAVALQDLNNTRCFVDEVQALGAKVALDDFGAGYTSFAYLKNLTADAVKIDGAFIRDLNRHPANYGIAKGIVDLARNLGMRTVAEWVEDRATLEMLTEIGVDYVQGYAIARPMAPELLLTYKSAADCITNEELRRYINSYTQGGREPELWDALPAPEKVVKFRPTGGNG